jgi:hypothetical protein
MTSGNSCIIHNLFIDFSDSMVVFMGLNPEMSGKMFEVLTAVKMLMVVFWVVTPCGLVGGYQHFRGTYCLYIQP